MTQPSDTSETIDAGDGSVAHDSDDSSTRTSTTETSGIETSGIDISDADVDDTEGGSPS